MIGTAAGYNENRHFISWTRWYIFHKFQIKTEYNSSEKSMEKKECPGCAMEVDREAEVCPICGYEFPQQSASVKVMVWVMVILLLLWLVF